MQMNRLKCLTRSVRFVPICGRPDNVTRTRSKRLGQVPPDSRLRSKPASRGV